MIQDAVVSGNVDRILVGVDFTTPALAAALRAAHLAYRWGGSLELMHVVLPRDVPVYRGPGWEANRRHVVAEAMGHGEMVNLPGDRSEATLLAHFVIDGGIRGAGRGEDPDKPDALLDPDAIALTYLNILRQPRSTWTWEIELRPWVKRF